MADAGVCTRCIDVVGHCQAPVESAHFDDFATVEFAGFAGLCNGGIKLVGLAEDADDVLHALAEGELGVGGVFR